MNLPGSYMIDDRTFRRRELLLFAEDIVASEATKPWQAELYRFILDFFNEEQPLYQRTSGTTGDPKKIPLKRNAMIRSARNTLRHFELQSGDRVLLCLPVQYIAGKMMVVRALVGELHLVTVEPSGQPLEGHSSPIDFAAMVPLQLHGALARPGQVATIKKLILGGGVASHTLLREIRKLNETEVYETFGMSETYTHFAVRKLNGPHPAASFSTLPGVQISTDERGCLVVEVPGVTDGPVITNDMVEITAEGAFAWQGRIDHVINSGGIKINPEILEERIHSITGLEVVIISLPDETLGNRLLLVAECTEAELPGGLREMLAGKFQKHEVPRNIITLPEFPRNRSMKIDREAIRRAVNPL